MTPGEGRGGAVDVHAESGADVISLAERRRTVVPPADARRCGTPRPDGTPCRNRVAGGGRCRVCAADAPDGGDAGPADGPLDGRGGPRPRRAPPGPSAAPPLSDTEQQDLEAAIREALRWARRRLSGDYEVDEYGFDRELTEHVIMPIARPLYRTWWRVSAQGLDHVPADSGALVVANHAGTLPFDAVMTKLAILDEHPRHRHLRELAADLALRSPVVGPLARKTGNTLAHEDDAVRLLQAGELVGVWPEGFKGIGKAYRDRYKLQRFGRGGYVEVALRAGVPIIPVAIVGSEEIYPIVANLKPLARLLGFPYFPITWQFPLLGPLGLVPLPSKWIITFGEPIETSAYGPAAADDPMTVFELSDRVRDTIQQMLYKTLLGRRSVFL